MVTPNRATSRQRRTDQGLLGTRLAGLCADYTVPCLSDPYFSNHRPVSAFRNSLGTFTGAGFIPPAGKVPRHCGVIDAPKNPCRLADLTGIYVSFRLDVGGHPWIGDLRYVRPSRPSTHRTPIGSVFPCRRTQRVCPTLPRIPSATLRGDSGLLNPAFWRNSRLHIHHTCLGFQSGR